MRRDVRRDVRREVRTGGRRALRWDGDVRIDPVRAHAALLGDAGDSAWLDGGADEPSVLARGRRIPIGDDPLEDLARALERMRVDPGSDEGFVGGVIGWLGYELRGRTTGAAVPHPGAQAGLLAVDRSVRIDPRSGRVELRALGADWSGELAAWRDRTIRVLEEAAARPAPAPTPVPTDLRGAWVATDAEYLDRIARCQAAIRDGEAYQLCLTDEFRIPASEPRPDAVALHRRLRTASPTHHGLLLRVGDVDLVGASPERFLRVRVDGVVESSPIKGTRRRDPDPALDAALRRELTADPKERAENVMIVDVVRNDLARVCAPGSIEVTRLLEVESYAQVHQLVSTVQGRLRPGASGLDAVAALFPAASMTGAPKRRATELLDAIEDRPRGPYAGVAGWWGADGAVDLAMTIRTIVVDPSGVRVGSGGGITALSDRAAELREVRLKAAVLLEALGADSAARPADDGTRAPVTLKGPSGAPFPLRL